MLLHMLKCIVDYPLKPWFNEKIHSPVTILCNCEAAVLHHEVLCFPRWSCSCERFQQQTMLHVGASEQTTAKCLLHGNKP